MTSRPVVSPRSWVGLLLLGAAGLLGPGPVHGEEPPGPKAAYEFLGKQMDLFHDRFVVNDDSDSGAIHFFPSGWMGDLEGLGLAEAKAVLDDGCTVTPYRGTTCIQLTYSKALAANGNQRWVAIYWTFPDGNWGKRPGYDLRAYQGEEVRLVFAARGETGRELSEFKVGGVNRDGRQGKDLPHQDKFGPVSTGAIRLEKTWKEFSIPLKGDLGSWIGGFCWATNADANPGGCRIYLDEIRLELGPKGKQRRLNEPRFIRSYVPTRAGDPDRYFRSVCYCYDQALALLAFVARGEKDDLRRAKLLADALVYAQEHDRHFNDGRLRTAYSCGDLLDLISEGKKEPPVRLPGWWNVKEQRWEEDEYCVSTDCGNLAWVMLALLTYWDKGGKDPVYLKAAERLGDWIHDHCYSAGEPGGYTGGVEGWEKTKPTDPGQRKIGWKSTEHNIDLYAAFARLRQATGDAKWGERAEHARRFVDNHMWNEKDGHLWTGTAADGKALNQDVIPLDIQPWALLSFRDPKRYRPGIVWAERNCWVERCPADGKSRGFDFNTDKDGVWWEGTGQMQVALRLLGERDRAADVLKAMRAAAAGVEPRGAMVASSKDGLTTGFQKEWGPWVYYRRPHVGATCWYIFAELGWNPYWAEPVAAAKPKD